VIIPGDLPHSFTVNFGILNSSNVNDGTLYAPNTTRSTAPFLQSQKLKNVLIRFYIKGTFEPNWISFLGVREAGMAAAISGKFEQSVAAGGGGEFKRRKIEQIATILGELLDGADGVGSQLANETEEEPPATSTELAVPSAPSAPPTLPVAPPVVQPLLDISEETLSPLAAEAPKPPPKRNRKQKQAGAGGGGRGGTAGRGGRGVSSPAEFVVGGSDIIEVNPPARDRPTGAAVSRSISQRRGPGV
jgi:hypothetical protein